MYNVQELATAAQHGIAVVAIVFNDGAYGNVRRMQRELYGNRVIASDLATPTSSALAESFGLAPERADDPDELRGALERGLARRPALIEVKVGGNVGEHRRRDGSVCAVAFTAVMDRSMAGQPRDLGAEGEHRERVQSAQRDGFGGALRTANLVWGRPAGQGKPVRPAGEQPCRSGRRLRRPAEALRPSRRSARSASVSEELTCLAAGSPFTRR